jgi:hypothetical protein
MNMVWRIYETRDSRVVRGMRLLVKYVNSLDCGVTIGRSVVLSVVTIVSEELTASIFGVNMEAV